MTSGTAEALTALGSAVGGGILTLVCQETVRWWKRPRLRIHFAASEEYCPETPEQELDQNHRVLLREYKSRWLIFKVTNDGRSIALSAYIINLSIKRQDGTNLRIHNQDSYQLPWSFRPNEDHLSIPNGVNFFVDICSQRDFENVLRPCAKRLGQFDDIPLRYREIWAKPGTFDITVLVAAEGVKPTSQKISFEWQGGWNTLRPLT